jgi:putative membrane protein
MPGRHFGPGPFLDGGWHGWLGLAFAGLSLLFWVALIALIVWAVSRWIAPRMRGGTAAPLMAGAAMGMAQPSAIELLRQRYARGEIDTTTFEQMTERILASEVREREGDPPIAPRDGEIYNT